MSIELIQTENGLGLIDNTKPKQKPLVINFNEGKINFRQQRASKQNEALAKAFNLRKYPNPTVIDTTAGLGQDAFILATLGCQVTCIERNPLIYKLLEDGLSRAQSHPELNHIINRIHLIYTDAITFLQTLPRNEYPEVIYCDPMFPLREKSAQVKKNMQILQHLIGQDLDTEILLQESLKIAKNRVVVKRPKSANPIKGPTPTFSHIYKSSRFDIYTSKHIASA